MIEKSLIEQVETQMEELFSLQSKMDESSLATTPEPKASRGSTRPSMGPIMQVQRRKEPIDPVG